MKFLSASFFVAEHWHAILYVIDKEMSAISCP